MTSSRSMRVSALLLLLTGAIPTQASETVWSSFAFILNGERVPLRGTNSGQGSLTTLGAQQLLSQGSFFRDRWLINATLSNNTFNAPLANIERIAIDNSQITVYTSNEDYLTGSALAFLQGLYPPANRVFAASNGGLDASTLANGSLVNYPLGGYQYPNIQSLSLSDPNSIWLEGHTTCSEYIKSNSDSPQDSLIAEKYNASYNHYQNLWSTVFEGTFPLSMANFDYAYDLYEYAAYQYSHNKTIRDSLDPAELNWLGEFASVQEFSKNGDLSFSGAEEGDMIRAVAGQTLAGKVLAQFQQHINSGGRYEKLNLMFGSFQPFLAFFALSRLSQSTSSALFQEIPQPGAAMVFELFSTYSDTSDFPTTDDFWVRFLYKNSTDKDAPFSEYPLFGPGTQDTHMTYANFISNMRSIAIGDLGTWCNTCDAVTLFCYAVQANVYGGLGTTFGSTSSMTYASLSPAIAGVIGAVTAIAVLGLAVVTAAVFGGLRISRHDTSTARRKSSLGGFKGAEKMASDKDLSVLKSGVRTERVGSWELGGPGPLIVGASLPDTTPGLAVTSHHQVDNDDDSIIMGRTPVKPIESL